MKYKIIHNIPTGEVSKVEMTAEEEAKVIQDAEARKVSNNEIKADRQAKADLKASAKAKLIAGEALTEEEADTIVL